MVIKNEVRNFVEDVEPVSGRVMVLTLRGTPQIRIIG